jgi:hypothetical protein
MSVLGNDNLSSLLKINLNGPLYELIQPQWLIDCWCMYISAEEMRKEEFLLASRTWKIFAIPDYVYEKEAIVADENVMLV